VLGIKNDIQIFLIGDRPFLFANAILIGLSGRNNFFLRLSANEVIWTIQTNQNVV